MAKLKTYTVAHGEEKSLLVLAAKPREAAEVATGTKCRFKSGKLTLGGMLYVTLKGEGAVVKLAPKGKHGDLSICPDCGAKSFGPCRWGCEAPYIRNLNLPGREQSSDEVRQPTKSVAVSL